jgi:hypothetical protein
MLTIALAGQAQAHKSILDFLFPPLPPLPPLPTVVVAQAAPRVETRVVQVNTVVAPAPVVEEVVTCQPDTPSFGVFHEALEPHGQWVYDFQYGHVWQPAVGITIPEWRPYCNDGRWIWTESGWFWQSDYSWGWAPFHYGRWMMHSRLGWVWAPGYVWGPSWVLWRQSDSYCGWAPMPPDSDYEAGAGFTYQGRNVAFGFSFGLTERHYAFVPAQRFLHHNPHGYRVPADNVTVIYQNTMIVYRDYETRDGHRIHAGLAPNVVYPAQPVPQPQPIVRGTTRDMAPGGRLDRIMNAGNRSAAPAPAQSQPAGRMNRIINTPSTTSSPGQVPVPSQVRKPVSPVPVVRNTPTTPTAPVTPAGSPGGRMGRITQGTSGRASTPAPVAPPMVKSSTPSAAPAAAASSGRGRSGVSRIRNLYDGYRR